VGSRSVSCWWREVSRISERDGDGSSSWFDGHVLRRIGDGTEMSFLYDRWIREVPLYEHFRRLFDLTENKSLSVENLFSVDSEQGVLWRWRRRLWQWGEEMLAECRALLLDAYDLLTSQEPHGEHAALNLVWHN